MILELNKQRSSSDKVELFQVQIAEDSYVYFTTYSSSVTFRDAEAPFTERTYVKLPIEFTGYEHKSDGAYARPRISFANVLTTFSDAIGTTNDGLLGMKIIRRQTLSSYLTSNPPIEVPKQVFLIDRIEGENAVAVTFELATPFDLAGIKVPTRYIIPNSCPWFYQGAAPDRVSEAIGACSWPEDNQNAASVEALFDSKNRQLIDNSYYATHSGGAYTQNSVYKVARSIDIYSTSGSVSSTTGYDYWQAVESGSGVLDTENAVRTLSYTTYSGATTYNASKTAKIYSDMVKYNNKVWVALKTGNGNTPVEGSPYWERIDVCSKQLSSCAKRFKAIQSATGIVSATDQNESISLPYGGFPSARRFR